MRQREIDYKELAHKIMEVSKYQDLQGESASESQEMVLFQSESKAWEARELIV